MILTFSCALVEPRVFVGHFSHFRKFYLIGNYEVVKLSVDIVAFVGGDISVISLKLIEFLQQFMKNIHFRFKGHSMPTFYLALWKELI